MSNGRKVFDVVPSAEGWRIRHAGAVISTFALKRKAVADARRRAHAVVRNGGLAQMRVRGQNGRIQYEATYGKDPRRYPS